MGINKDQVEGRTTQATGKIKEVIGSAVGNPQLEAKGRLQKNVGAVQAKIGNIEADFAKAKKTP